MKLWERLNKTVNTMFFPPSDAPTAGSQSPKEKEIVEKITDMALAGMRVFVRLDIGVDIESKPRAEIVSMHVPFYECFLCRLEGTVITFPIELKKIIPASIEGINPETPLTSE